MQTAYDIMTTAVITVHPETPLIEAANLLVKHRFNGLPVVDDGKRVVGVITEYDLILKGTAIHLPTFLQIFQDLSVYKKGSEPIREDLKKIFAMKVAEAMNAEPLTLPGDTPILKVAEVFAEHHRVNPIPIIDQAGLLKGIISRHDLLKFLGSPDIHVEDSREIDKNIDRFLSNYQNRFVLVHKARAHSWLLASILFAVVGFAIAWFLILRINQL